MKNKKTWGIMAVIGAIITAILIALGLSKKGEKACEDLTCDDVDCAELESEENDSEE